MSTSRSAWKGHERRIAKLTGGIRVPTSGGMKAALIQLAGDTISDYVVTECKFSGSKDKEGNKRISLQYEWFPKIVDETRRIGGNRIPTIVIHFKSGVNKDWAFIRSSDFDKLQTKLPTPLEAINHLLFEPNWKEKSKKSIILYESIFPSINSAQLTYIPDINSEWFVMHLNTFIHLLTVNNMIGCTETLKQFTFLGKS